MQGLKRLIYTVPLVLILFSSLSSQTIFPGLTEQELLDSLIANYSTSSTIGSDAGVFDALYGEIFHTPVDSVTTVYADLRIRIRSTSDPSSQATSAGCNVEHTWPKRFGSNSSPARYDMHHLFPARSTVNNARGNSPFTEIDNADVDTWYWQEISQSSAPSAAVQHLWSRRIKDEEFEPRDAHKGNVARAMFYFYTIYKDRVDDAEDPLFFDKHLGLLYDWHIADPVDSAETARTWLIAAHQDNIPNPFVLDATLGIRAYYPDSLLILPNVTGFSPNIGPVGTTVTITGENFSGATDVSFNGTSASFSVISDTEIDATVPAGASSGTISVTNGGGTLASADIFTITVPPFVLTVDTLGSGVVTLSPAGGSYGSVTDVTLTATADSGFYFAGWSGDLSGLSNPAVITMNDDKNVTAIFGNLSAGDSIVFEEAQTGVASNESVVSTSANLTAGANSLYLASISMVDPIAVTGVSGLGLTWSLVKSQCSARGKTAVEVWMAQGAPASDDIVTATIAEETNNLVIAVARYSGASTVDPIGAMVSGNTNGVDGACSGGSDNSSYSFSLTPEALNSTIFSAAALRTKEHTAGSNYIERAEISHGSSGNKIGVAIQDQSIAGIDPLNVDGSLSGSSDWGVIGLEIKSGGGVITQYDLTANTSGNGIVSLNPSGGTYNDGTVVTATANPDPGYAFSGWSGDLSGSTNPESITMDGHKSVTAAFVPEYNLTTNATNGSIQLSPAGGVYDSATIVTLTAVPDSGYVFTGWSDSLSGSTNPESLVMNGNKTATAHFIPEYALTTNANGGSIALSPSGGFYDSVTVVTLTPVPDSGYIFIGWSDSLSGNANPDSITMNSDKTVTANFLPQYLLTINASNGTVTRSPDSSGAGETVSNAIYDSNTVVTLTAVPDSGYKFVGWSGDLSGEANPDSITMNSDKSITAIFSEIVPEYTLATAVIGNGSITLSPGGGLYDSATIVTLTAVPDSAYLFTGWSDSLSGSANPDSIVMDTNKTVTANFSHISNFQFTVDVDTIGNGGVTLDPPGGIYNGGTVVRLTATADSGHFFRTWSGDLSSSQSLDSIVIDGNKAISAHFSPRYQLTTNVVGSGIITADPDNSGGIYDSATVVTLTATAASGYTFSGWSSGELNTTTNPLLVPMDSSWNITATFLEASTLPLALQEMQSGVSSDSNLVKTAANLTAVEDQLYLAAITMKAQRDVTSVSGLGLTWTLVKKQCSGRSHNGTEIWMAQGQPSGDDMVTANFSANTNHAIIIVSRYSGVDTANPIGAMLSGNTNGLDGICDSGDDTNNYNFNFTTTMDSSLVFAAISSRHRSHTPGGGYTENAEISQGDGSDVATLSVMQQTVDTISTLPVNGTFDGSSDWSVIAIELKPLIGLSPNLPDYTLTTQVTGNGSINLSPTGGIYDSATTVTLTAVADSAYIFTGWSDSLSGSANPDSIVMDTNKTVTANFSHISNFQFTVNVDTIGNGSVTLNPPGGAYDGGTVVRFTATADSGYSFSGWNGDLSGNNSPDSIVVDGNKNISAHFSPQYQLTTSVLGSGSITVNPDTSGGIYDSASVVTLTPVADSGYTFTGWSGDASGSANPLLLTMNNPKAVTATFIEASALPLALQEMQSGVSSDSNLVETATNISGVEDQLYLATITMKPQRDVTSLSGLGLTWTLVKKQCSGRSHNGTEIWMAQGQPSGDGIVTANLSADANHAVIIVSRYSGADTTNPVGAMVSGNTNGLDGACSGGDDNNSYALNITPTMANSLIFGAISSRHRSHTPGSGYTENAEISQGDGSDVATLALVEQNVDSVAALPIDGTFSGNTDWSVIAIEIKPMVITAQYQLTLNAVHGSITANPDTAGGAMYNAGTTVVLTATADSAYRFSHWSGDLTDNNNPDSLQMISHSNVTANFIRQFQLSSSVIGNGSLTFSPDTTGGAVYDSAMVITITPVPDSGYVFTGWSGVLSGNANPDSVQMDSNLSITATFIPAYILTVDTVGNGSIALNPAGGAYDSATVVTLTATADSSYRFLGWGGALFGANNPDSVQMDSNFTVSGTFIRQFQLSSNVIGNGTLTFSPDTTGGAIYDSATVVTITPVPDSGYVFTGWNGALSGVNNPDSVQMDSNLTVSGTFIRQFQLSSSVVGNGSLTFSPDTTGGAIYDSATVVTITPVPYSGYVFAGWSGALSGNANPDSVQMDSNMTVIATFEPAAPLMVKAKFYLAGMFNDANDSMKTTLRDNALLPLSQPFGTTAWDYSGSESVDSIPENVVDWVLVSLRTAETAESEVAARACFIRVDGALVDTSGIAGLPFPEIAAGDYFIVIHHRNHLAVMSSSAQALSDSSVVYNFSTEVTKAFGAGAMIELKTGVFGLIPGDANSDGSVDATDKNILWRLQNGTDWAYIKGGDLNGDGAIDATDVNIFWRSNNGATTQVPGAAPATKVSKPGGDAAKHNVEGPRESGL